MEHKERVFLLRLRGEDLSQSGFADLSDINGKLHSDDHRSLISDHMIMLNILPMASVDNLLLHRL